MSTPTHRPHGEMFTFVDSPSRPNLRGKYGDRQEATMADELAVYDGRDFTGSARGEAQRLRGE